VDEQFDIAMKKFNEDIEEMYEGTDKGTDEDSTELSDKSSIPQSDFSKPMASTKIFDNIFDQFLKKNDNNKKEPELEEIDKSQNLPVNTIAMKYAYIADSESDEYEEVIVKEKNKNGIVSPFFRPIRI